jgi:hypothetical protein
MKAVEPSIAVDCERALGKLLDYCRSEEWIGYDPYDGLNSPLARLIPSRGKWLRVALTQIVRRSPFNLRPILGIKKGLNPKGASLAASALMLMSDLCGCTLPADLGECDEADGLVRDFVFLMRSLESSRCPGFEEACWGYNFAWQSRAFYAPRNAPNAVCTVFAAHAYLDWHDRTGSRRALEVAESSCRFLLSGLNRNIDEAGFCFSYTPLDRARVHNVNLLAAELLARVFSKVRHPEYRLAALRAASYTLSRQREDGSWTYGESSSQQWIDSFHTGFMVVSLSRLIKYLDRRDWQGALLRVYEFYKQNFFLADSTPKYYHNKLFPIDIHSAAQAIITFVEMSDRQRAEQMLRWVLRWMRDPRGFFHYQRNRFYSIRTPHMRWSQAWMLYAMSFYLSRMRDG